MERIQYAKKKKARRRGFLKLDITAWIAILLMSVAGSVAAYLYHYKGGEQKASKDQSAEMTGTEIRYTADLEGIIAQCMTMVSVENSFVVFEQGTCVRLVEPISNPTESASASLKILASPNAAFVVKPLNNNNYLIVFNDYLFCWISAKDIADLKDEILSNPSLDFSVNDPESIKDLPEFEKKLGKFARVLMMEDAKTLTVKKIIRAANK